MTARAPAAAVVRLALLAAAWLAAAPAGAAVKDLRAFERIPVLEGGRVMPMGTYARMALARVSGRASAAGLDATEWLARAMFDPAAADALPVFLVNHADTADALRLGEGRPRRRVSYRDLEPALDRLQGLCTGLSARAARDQTPADRDLLRLASALELYADIGSGRAPALLPEAPGAERWIAAADLAARPADDGAAADLRAAWAGMTAAWAAGDASSFESAAVRARAIAIGRMPDAREAARLGGENAMNRLRPFTGAMGCYALAFALAFAGLLGAGRGWVRAAMALTLLGLALHTAGLGLRTFIMARPPVTNLYSTFVFVAWMCALLGLGVEARWRGGLGALAGGVGGALLLFIARGYELAGDPMNKVVAVLDSNLWLTVHVLTIAMGFAGCLMAGVVGHVALVRGGRPGGNGPDPVAQSLRALLAFGLVLTFVGTVLGGFWADQSWGRFWGWDPKENGALLILLWVAALLHARAGGLVRDAGLAVGAVFGNVVVGIAWLGVNLLNVGQHSYGWTSGAALGLAVFAAVETLFVLAAWPAVRRRRAAAAGTASAAQPHA